jgi:HK97 family phage major capsid protein
MTSRAAKRKRAAAGKLDRLKDTTNQPLRAPQSFLDLNKYQTKQASDTEAFVGQWSQLIIGVRTDLVIEASREATSSSGNAFQSLQVKVRAYLRADIALAHPQHFVYMSGIA